MIFEVVYKQEYDSFDAHDRPLNLAQNKAFQQIYLCFIIKIQQSCSFLRSEKFQSFAQLKRKQQNKMGVKCIKTEMPLPQQEPIFLYQNMVKMKKNTDPRSEYDIIERIGKGSFSEVFKVKSKMTNNTRAMKKIERRKNLRLQKVIINQFNILRELDHPNIMKMYEYLEDNDYIYILAELCPGKELFDVIIQNKYFPEATAKKIFYDIVGAVRYMHENHFMHRDLKPQNIMYDHQSGVLKIVDLGSALQFDSSQCVERKRVGTSYYIAPQVLSRCYNEKCDIWSLGVILYIMLSGQPPFKGASDAQILQRVKTSNAQFKKPIWNLISPQAKKLVSRMLTRNIKQRINSQQILKSSWFQSLSDEKSRTTIDQGQQKNIINCLSNIKSFKDLKSKSLQDGIITFIVNFVKSGQDAIELQQCFKTLDLNGDGVLSQEEMTEGIMKYLKTSKREANLIAQAVFKKIDTNHSGYIDYSQFVIAASNFQIVVSEENLDIAFDYLDADKSGSISALQLKQRLGENISEEAYQSMLKGFDVNSDGQISREEFRMMMKKLISRN